MLNGPGWVLKCISFGHLIQPDNMDSRVVSDVQTRAEGEWFYVRHNTDANFVKYLWYEWM